MPATDYSKFRLGDVTLAQLDALAASAGNRSQAIREAVAYWHRAVCEAAAKNAEELDPLDWERLAHLNRPESPEELYGEEGRATALDWSALLAVELCGMWEGRPLVLPAHKSEAAECRKLAKRISGWGVVRGYALYSCLRYFWSEAGRELTGEWWLPEVWLRSNDTPATDTLPSPRP